jgi:hypothetical protein
MFPSDTEFIESKPTMADITNKAVLNNDTVLLTQQLNKRWFTADMADIAASKGHYDCLKIICERQGNLNAYVCRSAAFYGHIDCLKLAIAYNAPLTDSAVYAVKHDNLECLKIIHEHGGTIDANVYKIANRANATKCLEYLNNKV